MKKLLILVAFTVFAANVSAQIEEEIPPGGEIRITADGDTTIKEYVLNGRVYMIQITPKKGKPYYLVDADGDGDFDIHRNELTPNLKIPSWVIFSW